MKTYKHLITTADQLEQGKDNLLSCSADLQTATEIDELCIKAVNGDAISKNNLFQAAKEGNAYAQNYLGAMYETGAGVEKDKKKAVQWYHAAAEQGLAEAQNNLGLLYYYGNGVNKNHKKAIQWFCKASEQGYAYAQGNLGLACDEGVECQCHAIHPAPSR